MSIPIEIEHYIFGIVDDEPFQPDLTPQWRAYSFLLSLLLRDPIHQQEIEPMITINIKLEPHYYTFNHCHIF